jgi:hypothetical protein
MSPARQRHTPIEIGGSGITLTFSVILEMPAISRASMTIHVVVGTMAFGFVRMSATNARAFLTDLRGGRSPIVGMGDEDGTVQIEYEIRAVDSVFLVRKLGQQRVAPSHHRPWW